MLGRRRLPRLPTASAVDGIRGMMCAMSPTPAELTEAARQLCDDAIRGGDVLADWEHLLDLSNLPEAPEVLARLDHIGNPANSYALATVLHLWAPPDCAVTEAEAARARELALRVVETAALLEPARVRRLRNVEGDSSHVVSAWGPAGLADVLDRGDLVDVARALRRAKSDPHVRQWVEEWLTFDHEDDRLAALVVAALG